ncbi:MAG: type II toxin-antitoxin system VapC family toxin [Aureliella sp.]
MIILDTNVVSELMKQSPEPAVVAWLDAQPPESIWTTSITIFEIFFGIETLPTGKRQTAIRSAFEVALQNELEGRVLNFDQSSASESAMISASLHRVGRPVDVRDVQIAGIVSARHATLATRNTKHFTDAGVSLVDPWTD